MKTPHGKKSQGSKKKKKKKGENRKWRPSKGWLQYSKQETLDRRNQGWGEIKERSPTPPGKTTP